ncbi:MAG: Smr/MutS family protein [Proteobacteria bacterium]|nr:Smr/MutS family protein [Pseudomonadota bacterium]MBU1715067.1 Smr/MutS family protein [Pseudomonadota bacterium]
MARKEKKKKALPVLSGQDNLYEIFSGEPEPPADLPATFAEALEVDLAAQDMAAVLRDKINFPQTLTPVEKIRQYPPPQAELDLHGCTSAEAELKTESFIQTVRGKGLETVRIITGKGLHSEGRAVLPDVIEVKLRELKERGAISTYGWEKGDKEESGALDVFLC